MKKFTLTFLAITAIILLTTNLYATTIVIDENHTLGLYGVQWENEVPQETRFPEFITLAKNGGDTEIILENNYFGQDGSTGFIMVANWDEEEKTSDYDIDYQENTINRFDGPILTTPFENWYIWGFGQTFSGGTVLDDVTRMFAEIQYGNYSISEEIVRANPVPEPATLILLASGLLGLAGIRRRK